MRLLEILRKIGNNQTTSPLTVKCTILLESFSLSELTLRGTTPLKRRRNFQQYISEKSILMITPEVLHQY
jgi:hypothetical protein